MKNIDIEHILILKIYVEYKYYFDAYCLCFAKINYYNNKCCDSVYMLRQIPKVAEFTYLTTDITSNFRLDFY
jgi:hypothetical protein